MLRVSSRVINSLVCQGVCRNVSRAIAGSSQIMPTDEKVKGELSTKGNTYWFNQLKYSCNGRTASVSLFKAAIACAVAMAPASVVT